MENPHNSISQKLLCWRFPIRPFLFDTQEIPALQATILPREPRRIFISREETKIDKPTKEPERKKSFLPPPIPMTPPTPIEDPAPYVPVKQPSPVPVPKEIPPIPVQEPSPPPIASKPR